MKYLCLLLIIGSTFVSFSTGYPLKGMEKISKAQQLLAEGVSGNQQEVNNLIVSNKEKDQEIHVLKQKYASLRISAHKAAYSMEIKAKRRKAKIEEIIRQLKKHRTEQREQSRKKGLKMKQMKQKIVINPQFGQHIATKYCKDDASNVILEELKALREEISVSLNNGDSADISFGQVGCPENAQKLEDCNCKTLEIYDNPLNLGNTWESESKDGTTICEIVIKASPVKGELPQQIDMCSYQLRKKVYDNQTNELNDEYLDCEESETGVVVENSRRRLLTTQNCAS